MEYRHPPLYYCISFRAFRSKERAKQRTGEESPCTDIELIGKL
jgi:hypothetical protein